MGQRNGIPRALVVAGSIALANFALAKPPDLPLDPRIACPEGRELAPNPLEDPLLPEDPALDDSGLQFEPSVNQDEPETLDADGQDASYEEMLRSTQPLDTTPPRRWWLEV